MTVTLSTPVRARTLLMNDGTATPAFTNAALLCPAVVNVFPRNPSTTAADPGRTEPEGTAMRPNNAPSAGA